MSLTDSDYGAYIDGSLRAGSSSESIANIDPSTGAAIADYIPCTEKDVDEAVVTAAAAFDDGRWRTLSPAAKSRAMQRLADLIEDNGDELARLESLESGKLHSAARNGEVPFAAECFRYHAGWCSKLEGSSKPLSMAPAGEFHAYTVREPVGVVGVITPYNGALVQTSWKLAPALAAGCTVVIKPDEKTPLSTLKLAELVVEAGIPPGVVNVVTGTGVTVGAAIVRHPAVRKISFTGSTETGKQIGKLALDDMKKVTLELGGKSPVIVLADADLDAAIAGATEAIFSNAGQVCVAGSRLYVEAAVYDDVVDGITARAESLRIGAANAPDTEVGPLISSAHRQNVLRAIRRGVDEGATLAAGGSSVDLDGGFYVEPTVLLDTRQSMEIVREEVFGPVLVASKAQDMQQCVRDGNDSRFGLAASIWTQNLGKAHRLAAEIKAGLVWVNCHGIPDMAVPFGGYKQSGWGRENGLEGLYEYTELKSVICKL